MNKILLKSFCMILLLGLACLLFACKEKNPDDGGDDPIEEVVEINFEEKSVKLNVGETYTINVTVKGAKGTIAYNVADNELIKVENGIVTALKAGKTTVKITVTCDDKNATTKEFTLSVEVNEVVKNEYTVSFEANIEGFEKDDEKVFEGEDFTLPSAPQITNAQFLGWALTNSADAEFITELTNVTENMKVYAIYKLDTKKITFVLDGGTYDGVDEVITGQKIQLEKPTREGYKFLGWSLEKDSPSYISELVMKEDKTVYANWREIVSYPEGTYAIYYDLDGGSWQVKFYTPKEISADFLADFKTATGHEITASELDCSHIESSWFATMMKNKTYLDKWMWLLDAIYVVAEGEDSFKAATADFDNLSVKGFYLTNLNGFFTTTKHTEGVLGTESANYRDTSITKYVCQAGPIKSIDQGPDSYVKGTGVSKFPTPKRNNYDFVGWKDQNGNTVTSISTAKSGEMELKAVWKKVPIADTVTFSNFPTDGMKLYETLKLNWTVTPADAANKDIEFYVLDTSIISMTADGEIKAKSVGTGKVRVTLDANPEFEMIIEINVWSGNYFDVSYETNSYTTIDEKIKLNAVYVEKDQTKGQVTWSSLDTNIATVDNNGYVTGVNEGVATIRATYKDGKYFDFTVTVLSTSLSDAMKFVIENHNSNALTVYNLGIGDGNPEYYYDVVGSVNDILFNDALQIDKRYYDKLPSGTKNYGPRTSTEFITVHYTGNMKYSADADNNCDYFNDLSYQASIHFVTGRTNLKDLTGLSSGYSQDAYLAFAGLNTDYAGWHASTGQNACVWDDTGLTVQDGDPEEPVISISSNKKYTINGRETTITIPDVPSGYSVNGNVLTVDGKTYDVFNMYGLRTKVENGKYYLARTYWGSQRTPKCISTYGGNTNSIGIESCVDMGSDLMHTWHVTAQLVAKLLVDYNLGFDRVVGHHFFSGKDCPQPFLENNMQLWYEFMDMVKAEYALLTTYENATITAKVVEGEEYLRDNGLLTQDSDAHCVTYEVSVTVNGKTEKVTLATCVESYFKCDCEREYESLQIQGYPVI